MDKLSNDSNVSYTVSHPQLTDWCHSGPYIQYTVSTNVGGLEGSTNRSGCCSVVMMREAVKCFEYFEMFVRCCIPFEMLWVVLKCYDNLLDALRWFYMLLVVVRYCKLFEMLCVIVRWFELWIILRHCGLLWIVLKCCEILFRSC